MLKSAEGLGEMGKNLAVYFTILMLIENDLNFSLSQTLRTPKLEKMKIFMDFIRC
jgi:hypothetical protein